MSEGHVPAVIKVIKTILLYKEYKSKDEVLYIAATMVKLANEKEEFDDVAIAIYQEAYERLQCLTFEKIQSLIADLKSQNS